MIKRYQRSSIYTPNLSPPPQRAQAALQAVNALDGEVVGDMGCPLSQSPVLRIIVDNLVYPVTLEVLYQVGAPSGGRWRDATSCGHREPAAV